jgi:AbrB family looped-hinge helix DNA binding protein
MSVAKISSKYQISIPAAARKLLNLVAGNEVEVTVLRDSIRLTPVRPNIADAIKKAQQHKDFSKLEKEIAGSATDHVRKLRGSKEW